jgi:hypothetical protein
MPPGHGCGLWGRPHLHIQSSLRDPLDCFVAPLLAMTQKGIGL